MPCIRPCTVRACVLPTDHLSYHRSVSHAGRDSGDMAVTSGMPAGKDETMKVKKKVFWLPVCRRRMGFILNKFRCRTNFTQQGRSSSQPVDRPAGRQACTQVILGTIDINETDFIKMVL